MKLRHTLCAVALMVIGSAAHAQSLQTCFKSPHGAGDQIGAINNISSTKVLNAARLVKRGKAIRLGIETNTKTPAFAPRSFALTVLQPGQEYGRSLGETKTNYNDDIIMGWVGIGTQLDGLGHIGIDGTYYNCNKGSEFVTAGGLTKLGIEQVPAVATRGVVLDMTALLGQDPVKEGTAFNRKQIDEAIKRQNLSPIGKGDVVIFYTGWTKLIGKDDQRYGTVEPGLGVEGAEYLASLGVAMVGSDTWALEVIPFEDPNRVFLVHQTLLAKNGIYILENVTTEEAVKDGVYEGLITVGPARVTGAVQSIVNPIFVY